MVTKRYFIVVHEEHIEHSNFCGPNFKQCLEVAKDLARQSDETYLVAEVHCEVGPTESPIVVKKLE